MSLSLQTPENLIAFMKDKGIKFNLYTEEKAILFLSSSTYYKKISSYKKNFLTHYQNGKSVYYDLDFAYLKELSSIDVNLRQIILSICLNIEHSVKVKIINCCVELGMSGYDIADSFFAKYPKVKNNIIGNMHNSYCYDLIQANITHLPIWVIVEVISFGDLCLLYQYMTEQDYFGDHNKSAVSNPVEILYTVHNLRNAAAHNHCLLRDLTYSSNASPVFKISDYICRVPLISDSQRKKALSTKFYNDFTCLLYSIDFFLESDSMKERAKNSIKDFINNRAVQHKDFFVNSIPLKNSYTFFKKIIDFYF